jgi:hypothetical protein
MRIIVCAFVFVALLLIGFLATPGIFKVVSPDYLLAQREYGGQLAKLTEQLSDEDAKIAVLQSKISNLDRTLKDLAAEAAATMGKLDTEKATPEVIKRTGIEFSSKANPLGNERSQANTEKQQLDEKRASINASRIEIENKISVSSADSTNIYLVTRALALGAIGAMISIFAKFLIAGSPHFLFEDRMIMSRMWASMVMGGIVAVVVIGLFLTGFISIFSNSTQNSGSTDYWKVTILCLFAGSFCDRLFQTAAGRMDGYLRTATNERSLSARSQQGKPPRRKKTGSRRQS